MIHDAYIIHDSVSDVGIRTKIQLNSVLIHPHRDLHGAELQYRI